MWWYSPAAAGVLSSTQTLVPVADVTDGGWLNEAGSSVNLYASVDEGTVAVDTDWIQSGSAPSADLVELQLAPTLTPDAGTVSLVIRHLTS